MSAWTLLLLFAVFVAEILTVCALFNWCDKRDEKRPDPPPRDPIAENAERHRRSLP